MLAHFRGTCRSDWKKTAVSQPPAPARPCGGRGCSNASLSDAQPQPLGARARPARLRGCPQTTTKQIGQAAGGAPATPRVRSQSSGQPQESPAVFRSLAGVVRSGRRRRHGKETHVCGGLALNRSREQGAGCCAQSRAGRTRAEGAPAPSWRATSSPRHPVTLAPWHPVTLAPRHPVALAPRHPGTLAPHHPGTPLPWRPVTLAPR